MIKLVDILKESVDSAEIKSLAQDVDAALKVDLNALAGELKRTHEDGEEAVDLNEGAISLVVSLMLSTPKLIEIMGGMINKISNIFKKNKSGTKAGDWLIHTGHKLEHAYIKGIVYVLKYSGIGKRAKLSSDEDYRKAATVLFYSILAVAAISAGIESVASIKNALSAKAAATGTAAYGAAKGGLAGIKISEILQAVKTLMKKIN